MSDQLPDHPNLLILITDQERYTQHFPPGWEERHLPNLERLKRNGLSFSSAFTCACMCSPSRSAIFTGRYPSQTGVTDTLSFGNRWNPSRYSPAETVLPTNFPNLATVLQASGAYGGTHYRGKWHLSKGVGEAADLMLSQDLALYGFRGWVPPDAGEDVEIEHFGGGYANHDARYADEAVAFLEEARGMEKPWCLVVSLVNPHDVLSYPNTYLAGGYTAADTEGQIELPETVDEDLRRNGKPTAQWMLSIALQQGLGALRTEDDRLAYINFYGHLLERVDREIGRVLDALDRGPRESTIIVRLADHGEMGMAHGGLRQKSFNAYEEAIRVPLVFSNPILFPARKVSDHLVSTLDLLPTLCSLAGVEPPRGLPGVDLSPILRDPDGSHELRDEVLFTYDDIRAGQQVKQVVPAANRIRCVRRQQWKFARYFHADSSYPEEFEMYYLGPAAERSLDPDPHELQNLAWPDHPLYDEPVVREKREELRAALARLESEELPLAPEREGARLDLSG